MSDKNKWCFCDQNGKKLSIQEIMVTEKYKSKNNVFQILVGNRNDPLHIKAAYIIREVELVVDFTDTKPPVYSGNLCVSGLKQFEVKDCERLDGLIKDAIENVLPKLEKEIVKI